MDTECRSDATPQKLISVSENASGRIQSNTIAGHPKKLQELLTAAEVYYPLGWSAIPLLTDSHLFASGRYVVATIFSFNIRAVLVSRNTTSSNRAVSHIQAFLAEPASNCAKPPSARFQRPPSKTTTQQFITPDETVEHPTKPIGQVCAIHDLKIKIWRNCPPIYGVPNFDLSFLLERSLASRSEFRAQRLPKQPTKVPQSVDFITRICQGVYQNRALLNIRIALYKIMNGSAMQIRLNSSQAFLNKKTLTSKQAGFWNSFYAVAGELSGLVGRE